eukprot:37710-Chlamydomonas_euryale.AAC.1
MGRPRKRQHEMNPCTTDCPAQHGATNEPRQQKKPPTRLSSLCSTNEGPRRALVCAVALRYALDRALHPVRP